MAPSARLTSGTWRERFWRWPTNMMREWLCRSETLVAEPVADLRSAGITADGTVREADFGHVARKILAVADEYDARMVVLGASGRTDMPHVPFGSVSHRLMHLAARPVLIVPRISSAAGAAGHSAGTGSERRRE